MVVETGLTLDARSDPEITYGLNLTTSQQYVIHVVKMTLGADIVLAEDISVPNPLDIKTNINVVGLGTQASWKAEVGHPMDLDWLVSDENRGDIHDYLMDVERGLKISLLLRVYQRNSGHKNPDSQYYDHFFEKDDALVDNIVDDNGYFTLEPNDSGMVRQLETYLVRARLIGSNAKEQVYQVGSAPNKIRSKHYSRPLGG